MFAESYLRFLGQKCVAKIDFLKFFCQIEAWYGSSFFNKVAVVWRLEIFFFGGGRGGGGGGGGDRVWGVLGQNFPN